MVPAFLRTHFSPYSSGRSCPLPFTPLIACLPSTLSLYNVCHCEFSPPSDLPYFFAPRSGPCDLNFKRLGPDSTCFFLVGKPSSSIRFSFLGAFLHEFEGFTHLSRSSHYFPSKTTSLSPAPSMDAFCGEVSFLLKFPSFLRFRYPSALSPMPHLLPFSLPGFGFLQPFFLPLSRARK